MFVNEVQSDSITLNYTLCEPEKYGITSYTPTLGEYSLSYMKEYQAILENYKNRLHGFPYRKLTFEQQKTYDVLDQYFNLCLIDEDLLLYSETLGPNTGIQAQLPILLSEYNFTDKDDFSDYLSLLSCVDDYFEEIIVFEKEKAKNGLFMSDHTADQIINQCSLFIDSQKDNALIEVFNDRLDSIDWLSKKEKAVLKKKNKKQVETQVIPAYVSLIKGLRGLKGSGINEEGLSHFPEGKNYYTYLVQYYTGSSRTIPEMRKLLEKNIDENILEIQKIAKEDPTILEKIKKVTFPLTDPDQILSYLEKNISDAYPPLNSVHYQIKYVHPSLEEYLSPAFYLSPPLDHYTENSIYINPYDAYDLSDIFTTLAHEGYPGHLYQTIFFNEVHTYPIRSLLNFSGYSEGWASYAEFDSYERAGLDSSTAALLKANQAATICIYGDIDLGVNYYGWSYEDTKKYLKKFGIRDEASATSIYSAMIQEPGNYLKYAGGYVEIMELQKTAEKKLKKNFDLKTFREYFLRFGPAPFNVIEKYANRELF
ncbi:MAG: DUF885 domain-containing protein [Acetivibrio sp.]